jgi:hypothetical protein
MTQPVLTRHIMDRCRVSFECFREFTRSVTCSVAGHALAVVHSLYPSVRLDAIDIGFARGTSDARIDEHKEEASSRQSSWRKA